MIKTHAGEFIDSPPFQIGPAGELLLPHYQRGGYWPVTRTIGGPLVMATPEEIEAAKAWEPQPDAIREV